MYLALINYNITLCLAWPVLACSYYYTNCARVQKNPLF